MSIPAFVHCLSRPTLARGLRQVVDPMARFRRASPSPCRYPTTAPKRRKSQEGLEANQILPRPRSCLWKLSRNQTSLSLVTQARTRDTRPLAALGGFQVPGFVSRTRVVAQSQADRFQQHRSPELSLAIRLGLPHRAIGGRSTPAKNCRTRTGQTRAESTGLLKRHGARIDPCRGHAAS